MLGAEKLTRGKWDQLNWRWGGGRLYVSVGVEGGGGCCGGKRCRGVKKRESSGGGKEKRRVVCVD